MDTTVTARRPRTLRSVTRDLHEQLARLERMAQDIWPSQPPPDEPTAEALAALLAVDRQHPGAWVSLKIIADFRTERTRYKAMEATMKKLVDGHRAETLTARFREGPRRLYRIAANHDAIDLAAVTAAANAALAHLNHKITVHPGRPLDSSFTRHVVTHAGRTATAYLRVHQYDVKVSRTAK